MLHQEVGEGTMAHLGQVTAGLHSYMAEETDDALMSFIVKCGFCKQLGMKSFTRTLGIASQIRLCKSTQFLVEIIVSLFVELMEVNHSAGPL